MKISTFKKAKLTNKTQKFTEDFSRRKFTNTLIDFLGLQGSKLGLKKQLSP